MHEGQKVVDIVSCGRLINLRPQFFQTFIAQMRCHINDPI